MMRVLLKGVAAITPACLVTLAAIGLNLPWPIEPALRTALSMLAVPLVHWTAYRAPERLPAPLLLSAGMLADLAAGSPLGFSALLYLGALASGRGMRQLVGNSVWGRLFALPVCAAVAFSFATLVPLAFTLRWPEPAPILAGLGLGLALEAISIVAVGLVPIGRTSNPAGAA